MSTAVIYTRLSLDREGTKESPETQEEHCRALADREGWEVTQVYCDRNLSGFKRGRRPAYEEMMAAAERGEFQVIVVFKLDRLTRKGTADLFAEVLPRLKPAGVELRSAHEAIDLTTAMGEGVTGLFAAMGRQESENISIRTKAAHDRRARQGRMHSGGSRQFGYDRSGEVVGAEAAVVRELAARVRAGESYRSLAFELNDRGVTTTMGRQWRSDTLAQMLRSPRLAGQRVHKGHVYPGDWEPILPPEEHAALLDVMSRTGPRGRGRRATHLLSGLAICGRCGGNLKTMGFRMHNGKPFERYQCVKQPGEVNCGGVAAAKESLERFVHESVLSFLSSAELRPVEDDGEIDELARLVDQDAAALVELTQARYVHRALTPEEYGPAREALVARKAVRESRLAALRRQEAEVSQALRPGRREDLDAWWEAASTEDRREALRGVLAAVVVNPAQRRGGNRFDTGRIELRWRLDMLYRVAEKAPEPTPDERAEAEALVRGEEATQ